MKGRAYKVKAGNLKKLKLAPFDLQEPNQDEVTVEVKAIGLNFADIFAIMGLYSATPKGEFIPGLEYAGVIIKVGSQVNEFKTGDKVMGVIRFGAYTTHLNIDRRYVLPLPQLWTFEEGAAYLVQLLTAYYALKNLGDIQKGQTVLIHSAVGGVGLW
ncbi:MAG: alcohol dehydrogenase catalytic domain-containing protein, partial [Bacteroidetes bacterium]|nr:alcohol dehydrogenase catalytic domain-containing protein [Bacteroidota bacterium]